MADEPSPAYEGGEGGDVPDTHEYDDRTTEVVADATTAVVDDDYVDEPIEDYVVNLVVNEQPDGVTLSPDSLNAGITDEFGRIIGTKPNLYETINGYTTTVYDELNGNGTTTGSKGLFGWSTLKLVLVGLAILCLIAIIIGILVILFGKKFKKKRPAASGTTTTTKAVVTKGISPDPKYQPVPIV